MGNSIPERKYSDEQRELIFTYKFIEDKSINEIAQILEMPYTSVRSILQCDLQRLKRYSKALVKNKRKYKLNIASDMALSLLLSSLAHIEKKLHMSETGERPLETWEINSFTRVLTQTIKAIDEARTLKKNEEESTGNTYENMQRAQGIDTMDLAELPDSFDDSTINDTPNHKKSNKKQSMQEDYEVIDVLPKHPAFDPIAQKRKGFKFRREESHGEDS
jgi:predicted DNA-binding protein YlxM (UPF0122 family)